MGVIGRACVHGFGRPPWRYLPVVVVGSIPRTATCCVVPAPAPMTTALAWQLVILPMSCFPCGLVIPCGAPSPSHPIRYIPMPGHTQL